MSQILGHVEVSVKWGFEPRVTHGTIEGLRTRVAYPTNVRFVPLKLENALKMCFRSC